MKRSCKTSLRYRAVSAALCLTVPLSASAQSYEPMNGETGSNSSFNSNNYAHTYAPISPENNLPQENSGPVYETMEPDLVNNTIITNTSIITNNSKNPNSGMCAQLPSENPPPPGSATDSIDYRYLSHEEQKAILIRQLLNKHGIETIAAERRDPAYMQLSDCDGGYQKRQCYALLQRSLTDDEQAGYGLDWKYGNLDIDKSWDDFKDALRKNPGIEKETALNESLDHEKHDLPQNFVTSPEADKNARMQATAEAVGLIDYALAAGNGEEAKLILERLRIINPSAAQALSCLVDQGSWSGNSYDLANSDPTKDKVGPITGTVFYKYDPQRETGFIPLLIGGGIALGEAAAGGAVVAGGSTAVVAGGAAATVTLGEILTGIGVAAGAVLMAQEYEKGPSGIYAPKGSWDTPTSTSTSGGSGGGGGSSDKDPKDKHVRNVLISTAIGSTLGTALTEAVKWGYEKIKEATGDGKPEPKEPKEPKPAGENKGPGHDGNPHPVEPEIVPLRVEESNNSGGPVVETDAGFEAWKQEMAAWNAAIKGEQLIQELSTYHFMDEMPGEEAAVSSAECELTPAQSDELYKHYSEDIVMQKMLSRMPIDFKQGGWNNLPEDMQQECAVRD